MPRPRQTRKIASWVTVCEKPHAAVKIEYIRIAPISARLRPRRSAITAKTMPPAAAASWVIDPSRPLVWNDRWSVGSLISAAPTIA